MMPAKGAVKKFNSLAFKGIRHTGKAEIIRRAGIRSKGDDILVDMDMLDRSLKSFSSIQDHSFVENGRTLVISAVEREPAVILAVEGTSETVVFELDSHQSIIAMNRIYDSTLPVVHVHSDGKVDVRVSGRLKDLCLVLLELKTKHGSLFNEISDVYYNPLRSVTVLRKRRTRFVMGNSLRDFMRLQYITGYLDSSGQYPKSVNICKDKVLIKQGV